MAMSFTVGIDCFQLNTFLMFRLHLAFLLLCMDSSGILWACGLSLHP